MFFRLQIPLNQYQGNIHTLQAEYSEQLDHNEIVSKEENENNAKLCFILNGNFSFI